MDQNFFKNIESKTGVNMKDIFELANSLQGANFKDEGYGTKCDYNEFLKLRKSLLTKKWKIKLYNRLWQTENNLISGLYHK